MKTSEFEDLVSDVDLYVQRELSRWRRNVFSDAWPDDISLEVLVEDFIEKLRAAVDHA